MLSGNKSARSMNWPPVILATSLYGTGAYPGPITNALFWVGNVEKFAAAPLEEPLNIIGGLVMEVAAEAEVHVEVEIEDAGDCVSKAEAG